MKRHSWILAAALSAGLGTVIAFGTVATAAEPSSAAVQHALVKRVDAFFAAQHNAPYGTYQFTDKRLSAALKKDPGRYYLLDIRTPSTWKGIPGYKQGHIAGAVNVPYLDIPKAVKAMTIPRNKIVVAMCPSGQLSNQTAGVLRLLGYNAYALRGGINGWKKGHYPLVASR